MGFKTEQNEPNNHLIDMRRDMNELSTQTQTETVVEERAITLFDSGEEGFFEGSPKRKWITVGVFAAIALLSIFLLAGIFSSLDTYQGINSTLDEKKNNVMTLAASTTAASAAISLLPGDTGSGIANKLVDLTSYFLVILAVIYLEKFLLTTFGFVTFAFMIPASCALFAIALFSRSGTRLKANLQQIGVKVLALAIALLLVVPVSVWVTDNVDASFEQSLANAAAATEAATQEIEASTQEADQAENQEDKGFFGNLVDSIGGGWTNITQGAEKALDDLANQLNVMVDTIAVMIVTSCLVPLLVLALFLWLIKVITGIDYGGVSGVMGKARMTGRSVASSFKSDGKPKKLE